jgi:hypothetical protein
MKSRIAGVLATLASALLLIGCATTDPLFPLYKADEAVFDNHMLGTWQPVITTRAVKPGTFRPGI